MIKSMSTEYFTIFIDKCKFNKIQYNQQKLNYHDLNNTIYIYYIIKT